MEIQIYIHISLYMPPKSHISFFFVSASPLGCSQSSSLLSSVLRDGFSAVPVSVCRPRRYAIRPRQLQQDYCTLQPSLAFSTLRGHSESRLCEFVSKRIAMDGPSSHGNRRCDCASQRVCTQLLSADKAHRKLFKSLTCALSLLQTSTLSNHAHNQALARRPHL